MTPSCALGLGAGKSAPMQRVTMSSSMTWLIGVASMAVYAGCVDAGPPPAQIDPAFIESNLLTDDQVKLTNEVNADLGGKIVYLGNEVQVASAAPGEKVEVIHYWRVIEGPGEQWRVFSHLQGAGGDWANVDYSPMRVGYGPDKWKAGDLIRDPQTFHVPKTWQSPFVEVRVGLYPKGAQSPSDRMPIVTGPSDRESRVIAARIDVRKPSSGKKASGGGQGGDVSSYQILKTDVAITIDGRADEPAWKKAPESPTFVTAEGSPEMRGHTRARLLWDEQFLYAFITVEDRDIFNQYREPDSPMWKEDVVELFIDADGNGQGYVELQVNPHNAQFDSWFGKTRREGGDISFAAQMKSAVTVKGSVDERGDSDTGWDVEIAIPLAAVKGKDSTMAVNVPPAVGDTWRLNVVRIDGKTGEKQLAASSWSQITYADFHAVGRMLQVVFADADGNTGKSGQGDTTDKAGEAQGQLSDERLKEIQEKTIRAIQQRAAAGLAK